MTEPKSTGIKSKIKSNLPTIAAATALAGAITLGTAYVVIKTKQAIDSLNEGASLLQSCGNIVVLEEIGPNYWKDLDTGLEYALDMLSNA